MTLPPRVRVRLDEISKGGGRVFPFPMPATQSTKIGETVQTHARAVMPMRVVRLLIRGGECYDLGDVRIAGEARLHGPTPAELFAPQAFPTAFPQDWVLREGEDIVIWAVAKRRPPSTFATSPTPLYWFTKRRRRSLLPLLRKLTAPRQIPPLRIVLLAELA